MIYCIGNKVKRVCKIGFSDNIGQRLITLQTGAHMKLERLGSMNGDKIKEKEIHERFAGCRLQGEWFEMTPAIVDFFDFDPTPEPLFFAYFAMVRTGNERTTMTGTCIAHSKEHALEIALRDVDDYEVMIASHAWEIPVDEMLDFIQAPEITDEQ